MRRRDFPESEINQHRKDARRWRKRQRKKRVKRDGDDQQQQQKKKWSDRDEESEQERKPEKKCQVQTAEKSLQLCWMMVVYHGFNSPALSAVLCCRVHDEHRQFHGLTGNQQSMTLEILPTIRIDNSSVSWDTSSLKCWSSGKYYTLLLPHWNSSSSEVENDNSDFCLIGDVRVRLWLSVHTKIVRQQQMLGGWMENWHPTQRKTSSIITQLLARRFLMMEGFGDEF